MALTVSKATGRIPQGEFMFFSTVACDNSYPSGGYLLSPAQFPGSNGSTSMAGFAIDPGSANQSPLWPWVASPGGQSAGGNVLIFDVDATGHLRAYYPVGSSVAVPGTVGDPIVSAGAVAVTGVNADGRFTAGRGKEVAATTDISAFSVKLAALGH